MKKWQQVLCIIGRSLIGIFFVISAFRKVIAWGASEQSLTSLFCDWQSYSTGSIFLQNFYAALLDWVPAIQILLTFIELLGGLLLFFGIKPRFGSSLLIIYTLIITILFHHFWFLSGDLKDFHFGLFVKNVAIIGGLLYIFAIGGKKKDPSKDIANMPRPNEPKIDTTKINIPKNDNNATGK